MKQAVSSQQKFSHSEDDIHCEVPALCIEGNSAHSHGRPAPGGLPPVPTHLSSTFFFSFHGDATPFFGFVLSLLPTLLTFSFSMCAFVSGPHVDCTSGYTLLNGFPSLLIFLHTSKSYTTRIFTAFSKMAQSFTSVPAMHLPTCKK